MNSWGNEQYNMPNMMAMPMMHQVQPGMPSVQMMPSAQMPHLIPPNFMAGDMNQMNVPAANNAQTFIGPVVPEIQKAEAIEEVEEQPQVQEKRLSRDRTENRRDRERDRDRGYRRSQSRNRDRGSYSSRDTKHRDRGGRDRPSKWDSDKSDTNAVSTMMMQAGQIMHYPNMIQNQMMTQMDMNNMQAMPNMANVGNMTNMGNMHLMPNMQMVPNMMMMNQQMSLVPMFLSIGVILPSVPGSSTPTRREKPSGCRTIFVGGLPNGINKDVIMEIFQRFGVIVEVKLHKQSICNVRFEQAESVEQAFLLSGCRFKFHEQTEAEATTLFVDYALNRDDQNEYERSKRKREPTPPRVEPFTPAALSNLADKIKADSEFVEVAPTLASWLERGECNKKNAATFYSLIQMSNNQLRRLFNEKMQIDEEYQNLKTTMKDKFAHILLQFEQVAKILTAARLQRVSDHFSKQQRRNIEMWLKMTEELDNIKEEFHSNFDEDEIEKIGKNTVPSEKYEQLRVENENLTYELEGYKNEAHLAKNEAVRKFETFKAHFIAQQALQNNKQVYPPLPPPQMPNLGTQTATKPNSPPPLPEEGVTSSSQPVSASDAKLISILTAFLMVHPLGATLDYLVSYVKSLAPSVTQTIVHEVLLRYGDVFCRKTTGVGACIEHKWCFVTFDLIKNE